MSGIADVCATLRSRSDDVDGASLAQYSALFDLNAAVRYRQTSSSMHAMVISPSSYPSPSVCDVAGMKFADACEKLKIAECLSCLTWTP